MSDQIDTDIDQEVTESAIENDDHLYAEDMHDIDEAGIDDAPVAPLPVTVPDIDFADDPAVRSSVGTFTALGLPLNSRELYAAEEGNFTFLEDWASSLRGRKGEQAMLAVELLKQAHERFLKADENRSAEIAATIEKAAGGKEEWQQIKAWADAESTPEEKAELESALSHGGVTAKFAVMALKAMRALKQSQDAGPGEPRVPANGIVSRTAPKSGVGQKIDSKWYADQIEALSRKYGADMARSREFSQVSAAWAAHKNRGSR